jgi:hypothetical protein
MQNDTVFGQKQLVDTAAQIFRKSGPHRQALLQFMDQNPDITAKERAYISEQAQICNEACCRQGSKPVRRSVTHQRKIVQITVEVHWTRDTWTNGSPMRVFWCLAGADLQETFRFLPKALNPDGSLSPPKRGTHHSRWYPLNGNYQMFERIALELRMLQIYVSSSGQAVKPRLMAEASEEHKDSVGILGLDLGVDAQILRDFDITSGTDFAGLIGTFKGNKGNPQKLSHGVYVYNKNGTQISVLDQLCDTEIQKIPNIYKHHINILRDFSNIGDVKNHLVQMMKGEYLTGLMTVGHHTMFWVRDVDIWYLCDPWKKSFSPGYQTQMICENMFDFAVKQINQDRKDVPSIRWSFLARRYNEQYKTEGSCSVAALSRVIQIGIGSGDRNGVFDDQINEPIADWAAMLASCMIRKVQLSIKKSK